MLSACIYKHNNSWKFLLDTRNMCVQSSLCCIAHTYLDPNCNPISIPANHPKSCRRHKQPVSAVHVISVRSLRATWLLRMRKLDNQSLDVLQALMYYLHTPCVQHLFAVSKEPHILLMARVLCKGTVQQHHLYVNRASNFHYSYKYFRIHLPHAR